MRIEEDCNKVSRRVREKVLVLKVRMKGKKNKLGNLRKCKDQIIKDTLG